MSLKYIGQLRFYGRRLEAGTTNSEFNEHNFSVQEEALTEAADEPKDDEQWLIPETPQRECVDKGQLRLHLPSRMLFSNLGAGGKVILNYLL